MRILLNIVFVFVLYSLSFSQRFSFVSYSTPEGLPQSQVNAITQDSSGYLWIGTFGGVSKFNGKTFKNYSQSEGLLNNRVTQLTYIDDIIIVGHDNGISFQSTRDTFYSVSFPENKNVSNVTSIIKWKNKIYVGSNGSGMFQLDIKNNKLNHVVGSPDRIRGLVSIKDKLVLATRTGVLIYDENEFKPLSTFPEESYSDITLYNDKIYATTYEGHLYCYNTVSKKIKLTYQSEKHRFRDIFISKDHDIWLNSKNGAIKYNEQEVIELDEDSGLPINDVSVVFIDMEGNVWLGSAGKGLLKFSGEIFTHYNKKSGLPSELIISTLEDKDGNYWLSSFDKGVFIFNPSHPENCKKIEELTSTVWTSKAIGDKLFFGSIYGLHMYENNKWTSWYEEDGLPANKITGLYKTEDNNLLIGTASGIALLNCKQNKLTPHKSSINKIQNIRDFVAFGDSLYLATQTGFYLTYKDELQVLHQFEGAVNSIASDSKKRIWIGTENGLFKYENKNISHFKFSGESGSDYINFIIKHESHLFVGTNNGLYIINLKTLEGNRYGINAGLVDLETNLNSAFIDSRNQLWFGTVAGLMNMNLNIDIVPSKSSKPKLHLIGVNINFENQYLSAIQNEILVLNHKRNNLSFEFDGIYMTNPKDIKYTYQLQGYSEKWSPASSNSNINFTNIPPGEYTLLVKAIVEDDNYSAPYQFSFKITPPYYKTWWFYSLLFIVVVLIILFLDRLRAKRIKQKNYQNNLEVKGKLLKLEQQSLNASMNRHFIFNSLNSIQYYINAADKVSANRYLTKFAKLIRKNLDSSHGSNGMVTLSDELERLELYLELESMRFKDKLDYEITIDERVETEMLIVPAMFLQPFIENSIIHGILPLKNKKGLITIKINDHFDHIRIEIFDNGVGIEKSIKEKNKTISDHESQGVLITLGRIELLQKISAKSIELIGPTQINESDNSVKGTLVIFKILKQFLEKP